MYTIRKTFKFELAHRLNSAYSKCCLKWHGHSYKVEVFLQAKELNEDSMVMDFGELKNNIQHYIDQWDHSSLDGQLLGWNPTAETMAKKMYDYISNRTLVAERRVTVKKVRVHETETGYAEYEED